MNNLIKNMEFSVLSSIIFDYTLMEDTILKPNDFSNPNLGKIFYIMQKLYKEGDPIDEDLILNKVPKKEFEMFKDLLLDIMILTPITNIKAHEKEIKENAKKIALQTLLNNSKKALEEKASKDILKSISKELELLEDEYKANSLLNIKKLSEIEVISPKFLLENVCPLQENEINIFSANGGSGKSYFTLLLMLHLSNLGKKCFCWYSEDEEGITKGRLEKLKKIHRNLKDDNLTIIGKDNQPLRIVERTNRKLEINEKFNLLKKELKDYDVILLDPLIAFYGGDENDNSEARYFMSLLNKWASEDKKTFIVIHHNNKKDKDGASSIRGASAFVDACRMQYSVIEDKENTKYRIAKIEKTNHFSNNVREYRLQIFDIPIVYEIKKEEQKPKSKFS